MIHKLVLYKSNKRLLATQQGLGQHDWSQYLSQNKIEYVNGTVAGWIIDVETVKGGNTTITSCKQVDSLKFNYMLPFQHKSHLFYAR